MSVAETTDQEHTTGSPESQPLAQTPLDESDDVEESLVEEISIDGMCGVY